MNLTDRCSGEAAERGELALTLALRHGGQVETALRYEVAGSGDRLLLVAGGISAGRHVAATRACSEPGWWEAQAPTFDLDRVRLLAIDWIGADGSIDLPIDPADQADAIAALLDHLGIARTDAFIGASYGGMVALHFAARHPSLCGSILVISASASAHPFASACRSLQRRALSLGEGVSGVALARAMAMLTYRTPAEFADRFAEPPRVEDGRVRVAAESYLDFQGERHAGRMSATAYRRLSESIDLHRIDPASIAVPATFAAVDSDALVPAPDVEALAAAVPGARYHLIHSRFGHDAFLKEEAQVAGIISQHLQSLETKP
jgi:homoserine O-acetyltransferase/O-succinyltransferase